MALGHEAQQKEIDDILTRFDGDMTRILLEVQKLIAQWLMTNELDLQSSLKFDIVVNDILTQSGYYTLVNRMVGEDFDKLYPMIQEGLALGGLFSTYTAADLAKITALQAIESNKFSVLANTSATTLRDNLYRYTLSNFTVDDIVENISRDMEKTNLKYAKTLANTVVSEMQQSTLDLESEDLGGVYLYIGVQDSVTRDFCNCVLNKDHYYNEEQKQKIQTAPERRYNCRHRLRMVSVDYAESQGYTKAKKADCT